MIAGRLALGLAGAVVVALCAGGAAARSHRADHRTLEQQAAHSRTLALARCYGRFIGWRDELGALMQASGSFTPAPDAPARFDRLEASFIDTAHARRHVTLHLRPTFAEKDFQPDLRAAFRTGLAEVGAAFGADDYKARRKAVLDQADLAPIPRMSALEANADSNFKPLGEPCDQLAAANP
jgi:hypothetical protein